MEYNLINNSDMDSWTIIVNISQPINWHDLIFKTGYTILRYNFIFPPNLMKKFSSQLHIVHFHPPTNMIERKRLQKWSFNSFEALRIHD